METDLANCSLQLLTKLAVVGIDDTIQVHPGYDVVVKIEGILASAMFLSPYA
jgi:hypothetical protein